MQGETLLRIISTFNSKDITLTCEIVGGVFMITTEKGVIEIKTTPYEDFPVLPSQGEQIGSLPRESIDMLLREVSFVQQQLTLNQKFLRCLCIQKIILFIL